LIEISTRARAGRLAELVAAVRALARRLERVRPLYVVGTLVVIEWLVILGVALTVQHNGWLWYQGGDQVWFYTTSYTLLHGQLPPTAVGYGWSILLLPLALVGGPNLLHVLPAIVLLNVLVLMPATMAAMYGIGKRLGGRLAGYWVLVLWIVVPLVGVLYTNQGYHQKYTELTLPQALGLTAMSDFPSMVMLAVSAYFALRTIQGGGWSDGVLAGLFAGFGVGIKPSSGLYLLALALGLLASRRWRGCAWVGGGLAVPLLALLVWKWRGLGYVPLFHAAGGRPLALGSAGLVGGLNTSKYFHLDWSHLAQNIDLLREHFWSGRFAVWLVIAGVVALGRRSLPAMFFLGGWFLALGIVKGADPVGSVQDSSLLRMLIAAIPAFVLLLAALPLLLPRIPRRLPPLATSAAWGMPRLRLTLVVGTALLFGLVPVAFAASAHRLPARETSVYFEEAGPIPTDRSLSLVASVRGGRVTLRWAKQAGTYASFAYQVLRAPLASVQQYPENPPGLVTRSTLDASFVDVVAPKDAGVYVYRVLVSAAWSNDPSQADGYIASPPVVVRVR
jgi:hypothetical protein